MEQQKKSYTESKVVDIKPRGMSVGRKKAKTPPLKDTVIRTFNKLHKDAVADKIKGALIYLEFKDGNTKSLVIGDYDIKEMVFYLEYMKNKLLSGLK